jgi:alkanesulfonate monooxygenase SsuD/methylene tetrahydromethanopterin reductase-like flavin-dependent oxidoreductase (luciferase family)
VIVKIGLALPQSTFDRGDALRYADIRRAARRAEDDGFDAIWIYDHLLFDFDGQRQGVWEGLTVLSALAEATSRVELGTLVVCTAFRNPALLAKMADAIDEISGGRLILGLGAGWHEPEFTAFGYPYDHLASRFEEAVAIIVPLVRTGFVDFSGTYERAPNVVSLPRGPRLGGPPILMGAKGARLLKLVAQTANAWNTAWLHRADEFPARVAPLLAACAEVGRDPATIELTVAQAITLPAYEDQIGSPSGVQRTVFASPEALAGEWRAFAAQGVGHLIVWALPGGDESATFLRAAVHQFREANAS